MDRGNQYFWSLWSIAWSVSYEGGPFSTWGRASFFQFLFYLENMAGQETFFSKGKQIQSTKRILSYAEAWELTRNFIFLIRPSPCHKKASGSYASTGSKWKSGIPAHAIYMWLLPIGLLPHKILSMFFRSYIGGPLFQSGADERRRCISICLGPKKKSLLPPALNGKRGRRG